MRINGRKKNRGERQKVTSTPVKNTENTYDELSFVDSEADPDNNWLQNYLSNRGNGPLDKFLQQQKKGRLGNSLHQNCRMRLQTTLLRGKRSSNKN